VGLVQIRVQGGSAGRTRGTAVGSDARLDVGSRRTGLPWATGDRVGIRHLGKSSAALAAQRVDNQVCTAVHERVHPLDGSVEPLALVSHVKGVALDRVEHRRDGRHPSPAPLRFLLPPVQ
jgi:hypothetical protein